MWSAPKREKSRLPLSPKTVEVFAPAKVNLTLHVTGQRPDGYHLLDSLVVFAEVGDHLTLTEAPGMSLTVAGPFAEGVPRDAGNLVWKAAEMARWSGHISLHKTLPHGAGIGGGSSDAAAVLRALGAQDVAAVRLGADVPACRMGRALRMTGIGEELTPVDLPPLPAVLVNPGIPVPTPRVFSALESRNNPPMPVDTPAGDTAAIIHWLAAQRNDLERPAMAQAPVIAEVLQSLSGAGAALARMSGSGATCFGLFEDMQDAHGAAAILKGAAPHWWVQATPLS